MNISIQTSFDWRHKILNSLTRLIPEQLASEEKCYELELALSNKGSKSLARSPRKRGSDFKCNQGKEAVTVVQVVTAVERNDIKYLKAVESKRLSQKEIDKHPSYKANPHLKHKALLAKGHLDSKDNSIHLQKVNNTHSQLRTFLQPFNGVSSKYLQKYLNWFAYAAQIKDSKTTIKQWLITILLSDHAYELFRLFKENAIIIRT